MTDQPTVVSTTPSGTEILYELGVEPAAVSHACDYPPAATERPRLNTSRVDAESSADRDAQADGRVYDLDVALLQEIDPDLIVTQSVCGVCAVDERLVEEHLAEQSPKPTVLALSASDLDGVAACIREVGAAVDRSARAADLVERFEDRLGGLRTQTADAERPSVVVLEWLDPLHVAANWVPELVAAAGGRYPLADPGERSAEIAWRELRDCDPDVLVVAPCSFDVSETRDHLGELRDRPGWADLRAVETGRVFAVDGRPLNRWTPRLADAARRLADAFHPTLFADAAAPQREMQFSPLV